jgi:very-short-patch-repair endonuclease
MALAESQHGVVSVRQLYEIGFDRTAIKRMLRSKQLQIVYRGVYSVGHRALTTLGRFPAAVLACGEGAVLSHRSAALLWGLQTVEAAWIEMTVQNQRGRKREGLLAHRCDLPASDVTTEHDIRLTTPGRTLIDLADVLTERGLERAFDQADYLRLDCTGLRPLPGRTGLGRLQRVLADHTPGSTLTRSELEEVLLALCRRSGLPRPEVNVDIEGHLSDFVWRSERLIVEADSRAAHTTLAAFENDRLRDADLLTAGWRVLRVTDGRLTTQPQAVATQLRRLLGA